MTAEAPDFDAPGWETDHGRIDGLFSAIARRRRRSIIRHLDNGDCPIAMADLARDLAAGTTEPGNRDSTPERILRRLHHVHVPKLAEVDVVEFDDSSRTITKGENFDAVTSLLASVTERGFSR